LGLVSLVLVAITWFWVISAILKQVRRAIAAASHRCIVLIINIELDPVPLISKEGHFLLLLLFEFLLGSR